MLEPEQRSRDVMSRLLLLVEPDQDLDIPNLDLLPGMTIVLVGERSNPLHVVSEPEVMPISAEHTSIWDAARAGRLHIATTTNAETAISDLAQGMLFDRSIRWHVVLQDGEIIGAISPDRLMEPFALQAFSQTEQDEFFYAVSVGTLHLLSARLYGDSHTEPPKGLCYRCTRNPSHEYRPSAFDRDQFNRPLCPEDGEVMTPHNPCHEG